MAALTDRAVLIAGATSDSGRAAARTLLDAGAHVVATGRDAAKLAPLAGLGAETATLDLTEESAVRGLVEDLHARGTRIDGLLHLVGGWRGGGGLAGQTEADYRALEASFTALRHVSRALDDDLRDSSAGRLAIASSTAVARPLAGGAKLRRGEGGERGMDPRGGAGLGQGRPGRRDPAALGGRRVPSEVPRRARGTAGRGVRATVGG